MPRPRTPAAEHRDEAFQRLFSGSPAGCATVAPRSRNGPRHETGGRHAERNMAPVDDADPRRGGGGAHAGRAGGRRDPYQVSGKQTVVDEETGMYKMHGSLVGDWTTTSFSEIATAPFYQAKGTERSPAAWTRARWLVQGRPVRHAAASRSSTGPSSTPRAGSSGARCYAPGHRRDGRVRRRHGRARDGRHPDRAGRRRRPTSATSRSRAKGKRARSARAPASTRRVGLLSDPTRRPGALRGARPAGGCCRAPARTGCAREEPSMNQPQPLDGTVLGVYESGS